MTPSQREPLPEETRIGRTALRVADRGATVEFYRRVVGLEVLTRDDRETVLGAGSTPLLVVIADDDDGRRPDGTGLYHNAFRVPTREALGDALKRVRERWTLSGSSDHGVSEALYLADPEGNGVEIYRDRPHEAWPVADDGRVRMGTDPLDLASLADDAAGDPRAPPGTDVGHVHLEVASLEAFRRFYVGTLGFDRRQSVPGAEFVAAGGYHHHVGANTWQRRSAPTRGRGLAWFEVVVPDDGALEAVRTRLAEAGVSISDDDGLETTDPDDNAIRFRADPAPNEGT